MGQAMVEVLPQVIVEMGLDDTIFTCSCLCQESAIHPLRGEVRVEWRCFVGTGQSPDAYPLVLPVWLSDKAIAV